MEIADYEAGFAELLKSIEQACRRRLDLILFCACPRAKGRFLSLEKKMMLFPAILNPGAAVPYNLSDPQQIQEPFTTFLSDLKETRHRRSP
ncbi:MAG: hypothetical protein ACLQU3_12755 [Limisphaerales bacterium]